MNKKDYIREDCKYDAQCDEAYIRNREKAIEKTINNISDMFSKIEKEIDFLIKEDFDFMEDFKEKVIDLDDKFYDILNLEHID